MSWASGRVTSRIEDRAYSLLGIFDINMPLIHGEGENAFRRLLLEILRSTDDESIFVWTRAWKHQSCLLPSNPDAYGFLPNKHHLDYTRFLGVHRPPYTVTNKGLEIRVPAALTIRPSFLLPLNCRRVGEDEKMRLVYTLALERKELEDQWPVSSFDEPSFKDSGEDTVDNIEFLFSVSVNWVWGRTELDTTKSEVIYVKLFDL